MEKDIIGIINKDNIKNIKDIKKEEKITEWLEGINDGQIIVNDYVLPFEVKSYFEENISISLPKEFDSMNPEYVKFKYPSENRPNIIISDINAVFSFTFSLTNSLLNESEIEEFKNNMKKLLGRMNGSILFKSDGIIEINNKACGFLEFISPAIDTDIYNLMYFVSYKEKALLVGFSCPKEDSLIWEEIAKAIFRTLTIKEGN